MPETLQWELPFLNGGADNWKVRNKEKEFIEMVKQEDVIVSFRRAESKYCQ